jgi:hypothetical protein
MPTTSASAATSLCKLFVTSRYASSGYGFPHAILRCAEVSP